MPETPRAPTDASVGRVLVACPSCDRLYLRPALAERTVARCRRCADAVVSRKSDATDQALAFAVASFVLTLGAVAFPFLSISRAGIEREISVADAVAALSDGASPALALLAFGFVVAAPLLRAGAMILALTPVRFSRHRPRYAARAFRWALWLGPWAMAEIFMIGVAVSLIKLSDLANIGFGPSFYIFVVLVVVTALERWMLCPDTIWSRFTPPAERAPLSDAARYGDARALLSAKRTAAAAGLTPCPRCGWLHPQTHRRCVRCDARLVAPRDISLQRAWAWLAAAALTYLPANLWPITVTRSFGETTESTIISGVLSFLRDGDYFVAGVIFAASVLVPAAKFAGILAITLRLRRPGRLSAAARQRLHKIVEFIGRWSMIDVFVVAVLAGIVQMGLLASISVGPAAIPFALTVVFTMFAAEEIDMRVVWRALDKEETAA
ncbi:MAG: PqiA/YebS family transporter subunit [Pseudomonadota bacterium]